MELPKENLEKDIRRLFFSKIFSSFGSAFSNYALPLYVYSMTKNITHIGMQWAVIALVGLFSGYIGPKITIFKNDKQAYIYLDILLAISALIPFLLHDSNPIVGAYISTALIAFFDAQQSSYCESLLAKSIENLKNKEFARIYFLSSTDNGKHIGMLLGYFAAFLITKNFGHKTAFIVDSLTFLISGIIVLSMAERGHKKKKSVIISYSILFQKKLINLSIAQMLGAMGLFIFNGIWIVAIKKTFQASDIFIIITYVLQYLVSVIASRLIVKKAKKERSLTDSALFFIRFSYGLIFVFLAMAPNIYLFLTFYTFLNFLIPFSLPGIKAMFQREVHSREVRGMAIGRAGLTSLFGAIGAVFGSISYNYTDFRALCGVSALIFFVGAYFFFKHIQQHSSFIEKDNFSLKRS